MGFSETILEAFQRYTAARCAAHLLPRIKDGDRVLDVGCGVGSITVGLAQAVGTGEVHGIDMEESQIEMAATVAQSQNQDNVFFQVADALALPFDDNYFDVVHCHGILTHVPDTAALLKESRRVLKPGGVISARETITASCFTYPDYGVLGHAWDMFADLLEADDGHPQMGKQLKSHFVNAGLSDIRLSTSWEIYTTPQDIAFIYGVVQEWFLSEEVLDAAIKYGAATRRLADQITEGYERWIHDPGAICGMAFGEVVATNP